MTTRRLRPRLRRRAVPPWTSFPPTARPSVRRPALPAGPKPDAAAGG